MGIIRKAWSVSSFGVVPYRSGSEKVVRQLRAQAYADRPTAVAEQRTAHAAEVTAAAVAALARQVVPQGQWVADPSGRNARRYHDGAKWTGWVLDAAGEQTWDAPTDSRAVRGVD